MRPPLPPLLLTGGGTVSSALSADQNSSASSWIARRTNWGGEIELVVLSELLRVDIAVWSPFEGAEPLRYRCDDPTGEIHLLYSGTHYDAFVARTKGGDTVARFPAGGDPALEARIEALLATAIAEASKRGSA